MRLLFAQPQEERSAWVIRQLESSENSLLVLSEEPEEFELEALQNFRSLSREEAAALLQNPNYRAALALRLGLADIAFASPNFSSRERIIGALQLLKKSATHKASSFFMAELNRRISADARNDGWLFLADCALNVEPSAEELAHIALDTAENAQRMGLTPKIAFLSFSTHGSSDHPSALKMREATALAQKLAPHLLIDGEMQADTALMDAIAQHKAPNSPIAGQANILIFPDLNSGNIAYKLIENLSASPCLGPILQGLSHPFHEVSRGVNKETFLETVELALKLARDK